MRGETRGKSPGPISPNLPLIFKFLSKVSSAQVSGCSSLEAHTSFGKTQSVISHSAGGRWSGPPMQRGWAPHEREAMKTTACWHTLLIFTKSHRTGLVVRLAWRHLGLWKCGWEAQVQAGAAGSGLLCMACCGLSSLSILPGSCGKSQTWPTR